LLYHPDPLEKESGKDNEWFGAVILRRRERCKGMMEKP
jgi:hypothetical protein